MTMRSHAHQAPSLAAALSHAIDAARAHDPSAAVIVVTTSTLVAELARHALAATRPIARVRFTSPDALMASAGELALGRAGRRLAPPGFKRASIQRALSGSIKPELEALWQTLRAPGWRAPLARAIGALEAAEVPARALIAMAELLEAPDLAQRAAALGHLLAAIDAERLTRGFDSLAQRDRAALKDLEAGLRPPEWAQVRAVILLGDMLLSEAERAALRIMLDGCSVHRVAQWPLEALEPAPGGLRELGQAAGAEVIAVAQPAGALGALSQRLFGAPCGEAVPSDETVRIATCADDAQELQQLVAQVLAAIERGTALDRIAIALAEPERAEALRVALDEATIPAVWQVAPPLLAAPASRALLLALRLADTPGDVDGLADLLEAPSTERPALGASLVAMRATGLATGWTRALDAMPEESATRARAVTVTRALDGLPERAPLREHAAAWAALARLLLADSPALRSALRLLESWRASDDTPVSRADARAMFEDALAATQQRAGALGDRAVRVLPPMAVAGGDFDAVFACGLTRGRWLDAPREDPLLCDALIHALRAVRPSCALLSAEDATRVAQRRAAALIAGCRGRLWLSHARVARLDGRALRPDAFLFELVTALDGARAGAHQLAARADLTPDAPAPPRALASDIARAINDPTRAARAFACVPVTASLLKLHRVMDRLEAGDMTAWHEPHAGAIAPQALSLPDTLSADQLATLALSPVSFLIEELLGARGASAPLRGRVAPGSEAWLRFQALRLAREVIASPDPEAAFMDAWLERVGPVTPGAPDALRELGRALWEGAQPLAAMGQGAEEEPPQAALGAWAKVSAEGPGRRAGAQLTRVSASKSPKKLDPAKRADLALLIQALVLREAGEPIEEVGVAGLDAAKREALDALPLAACEAMIATAHTQTLSGLWPASAEDRAYALDAELGARLILEGDDD